MLITKQAVIVITPELRAFLAQPCPWPHCRVVFKRA